MNPQIELKEITDEKKNIKPTLVKKALLENNNLKIIDGTL